MDHQSGIEVTRINGCFKDPHVFPYLIKGFDGQNFVKFESRRNLVEANQTLDRFVAEGLVAFLFEIRELVHKPV